VVLPHDAVLVGELCWSQQMGLADRFALEIVDRAGYRRSQEVSPGEDLDTDAQLVAALLTKPVHLVGQSSGAVAAMLAAALQPDAVLSLTLCEPPAFQVAPDSPEAQQKATDLEQHLHRHGDDADWLRGFLAIVGRDVVVPDQLPPRLAQGVQAVRAVRRRPWEGDLPVDQLATASLPKLVISGNHSLAFEAICDALTISQSSWPSSPTVAPSANRDLAGARRVSYRGESHILRFRRMPLGRSVTCPLLDNFARHAGLCCPGAVGADRRVETPLVRKACCESVRHRFGNGSATTTPLSERGRFRVR
jgi:pimeloyl-ACP methyl ester carboxylesterase